MTPVSEILASANSGKLTDIIAAVKKLDQAEHAWGATATIHVLRNYTLEQVEPFLKLACYRRGIRVAVRFADYDTYMQELVDPQSPLRTANPDMVFISLWLDNLKMAVDGEGRFNPEAVWELVEKAVGLAKSAVSSTIAVNTMLPRAAEVASWGAGAADGLNAKIRTMAENDPRVVLADFALMVRRMGMERAVDRRYWFMFKSPLTQPFMEELADRLAQALAVHKGYAKKVLVLDCDNTLWGGIIGEDELGGIKLDPNEFPGNIFHTVQKQVLQLRQRGVVLALCSKNNEADVMDVLNNHPNCLIKKEHLAAWRVNWQDKAQNIRELAAELNLGLDSMVFIDDSRVELGLIREQLPMVDVLQVPEKLYDFPDLLFRYTGFLQTALTKEDVERTEQYIQQRRREEEKSGFADIEQYLGSLGLEVEIGPPRPDELQRVMQLTQKTNQFNLTTRRYLIGDIERFASSDDYAVMVLTVRDKYGDYGLTGLSILSKNDGETLIDTLLMSCRVLGRRVEDILIGETLRTARMRWGSGRISAQYTETPKNGQVALFYEKYGFHCARIDAKAKYYEKGGDGDIKYPPYIKVLRRNI